MTTRYYASFQKCETCGHEPESLFLFSTSAATGGYKITWSTKTAQSIEWLKGWLEGELYILAGVTKFDDNYQDEYTAKELLELINKASRIVSVDFIPV